MDFVINAGTRIEYDGADGAVINAVNILSRDIKKKLTDPTRGNVIKLTRDASLGEEEFTVTVGETITVAASDSLGFVYGLLYISEKFLGILPFWFWMDQKIEKTDEITVKGEQYKSVKPAVKYRGWFINDEVLIMKWAIDGDSEEPWRMAFEALLRCGGNMVIPGTDKNSRLHRRLAADMGLWITHHHAEPLGAEMFARAYPDLKPNYLDHPDLFNKLWEDAVTEQKDGKTIWCLGFRGQGDAPFWSHDTSGKFDTDEKRGKMISDIIELQRRIVLKHVKNSVFCTNLYGEVMELYDKGLITLPDDVIKISADNGFGKMVTRRRDNHTVRVSSMPKERQKSGGIYYHVSFYDLQAANHITMFPNSVDFMDRELTEVTEKNMTDYWLVNCSNVRPHAYFLDAVRKKWMGESVSDETQSVSFAVDYYGGNADVAEIYRDYHTAMLKFGDHEDEHAGEQFYNDPMRVAVNAVFKGKSDVPGLNWISGAGTIRGQIKKYTDYAADNTDNIAAFYKRCQSVSERLNGDVKQLFDATILMQTAIHRYCTEGLKTFGEGYEYYADGDFKNAFMTFGRCAELYKTANRIMRGSEYGVWKDFYYNDCFADIKHSAYMAEKIMGLAREMGDSASHVRWYRDAVYAPEDREIMTLLVNDNHMTDWELYEAFKRKENVK